MTPAEDFTELGHFEVDPRSVRLLDEAFCRRRQVVVLGRVEPGGEEPVTVGMLEPARGRWAGRWLRAVPYRMLEGRGG